MSCPANNILPVSLNNIVTTHPLTRHQLSLLNKTSANGSEAVIPEHCDCDTPTSTPAVTTSSSQTLAMSVNLNQALAKLSLGGNLNNFEGETSNVMDFLEDFDRQIRMSGLEKDQEKLDVLVSLLTESAKTWYRSLPIETKDSYKELRKALKDTYATQEQSKHLQRAALFHMKQEANQSVRDFIIGIQAKSRGLEMADKDLVSIVISGLQPQIKQHVVMAKPTSLLQILQSPAAMPEFVDTITPPHVLVMNQELQAMRQEMSQLTAAVNTARTAPTQERQVTFQPRERPRSKERTRDKSQDRPRERSQDRLMNGGQQNWQNTPKSKCRYCGSVRCYGTNNCPARNGQCNICGKTGHFAPVCRHRFQQYRPRQPNAYQNYRSYGPNPNYRYPSQNSHMYHGY